MARKPTGNPCGPVPKPLDWAIFEQLCEIQCTQSEIASVFRIHVDTLRDRTKLHYGEDYSVVYKKFSEHGKTSLRRAQYNLAKTNTAMAIWLGKQWLGQKDNSAETVISQDFADKFKAYMDQITALQNANLRTSQATESHLLSHTG